MTVGVVILTLNGAKEIAWALAPVLASRAVTKTLVVDSSSTDETAKIARELGAEVVVSPRSEFNHGATREYARGIVGTEIVVFLTQDVVPEVGFIEPLVAPIISGEVVVAYSRQLPHRGADFFEAFPREFNYPAQSNTRRLVDATKHGVYTFFCSDSSAAYLNKTLDEIGGFKPTLTNEDYFAVAALLRTGHKIRYVAESRVEHSHRYSYVEEFKRYFDTGYVRAENPWVNAIAGAAEGRGASFLRQMLRQLARRRPFMLPYAVMQTGVKWVGYRVGFYSLKAPLWWKHALSGQPYYWRSRFAATGSDCYRK
jgi:rhamnosyltransferase